MTHNPSPAAPPPLSAPTGSDPLPSNRRLLWAIAVAIGLCVIGCVVIAVGGGIWGVVQRKSAGEVAVMVTAMAPAAVGTQETRTLSVKTATPEPTPTSTPTPAPNGVYVAEDGNIWLVMDNGEVHPIVDTGGFNPEGLLAWSPNAQHLIATDRDDQLHVVNVTTGQTTLLVGSVGRRIAWSSDGQKLAFFHASPDESNRRWWRLGDEMRIGIVNPEGEPLDTLVVKYDPGGDLDPASYRYAPMVLFWLTGDQHLVLELAAVWQFEMAARVGSQIHLANTGTDSAFHRFADHLGEAQAVSLAPDGQTLAFVAASGEEGKLGIYTIDPLGSQVLRSSPFGLSSCDNCFSQWLSDGSGIVFGNRYAHRGCWFDLYQTSLANRRVRRLYHTNECHPDPEFAIASDDSSRMVYAENDEASGDITINLVPSADAAPVEIARMAGVEHLTWSSGGKWLAFAADGAAEDQKDVFIVSPRPGSQPTRLATHDVAIQAIEWSPDEQQLAVTEGDWETPSVTCVYNLRGDLLQTFDATGLAFRPLPR